MPPEIAGKEGRSPGFEVLAGHTGREASMVPTRRDAPRFVVFKVGAHYASTAPTFEAHSDSRESIRSELIALFHAARDAVFEDGMESIFSTDLNSFLVKYSTAGIELLRECIEDAGLDPTILAEALRWIGRSRDSYTYRYRFGVLVHCLSHPSPAVRDGAILGLTFMANRAAIPRLQAALEREENEVIRDSLQLAVEELEG
jgi:hypothetical protein